MAAQGMPGMYNPTISGQIVQFARRTSVGHTLARRAFLANKEIVVERALFYRKINFSNRTGIQTLQ